MIYLYSYLIISMFITFSTAAMLKNRFGSLEYVVELMRFADKGFDEACEGFTNEQLAGMILVVGMLLSPFIALLFVYRRD